MVTFGSSIFTRRTTASGILRLTTVRETRPRHPVRRHAPLRSRSSSTAAKGFTLLELLVVIGIIATLAALVLPALSRAKIKTVALACMGNTRQLQIAWQVYAGDNQDHFVLADQTEAPGIASPNNLVDWVNLDYGAANRLAGCMNPATVNQGLLWPYVKNMAIYRCPDQKQVFAGVKHLGAYGPGLPGYVDGNLITTTPVRSYSISMRLNGMDDPPFWLRRTSEIVQPDPSMAFVFIDENLYTVSGGSFWFPHEAGFDFDAAWVDVPAVRHGGNASLSFADGHCELHRWVERSTPLLDSPQQSNPAPGVNGQTNHDIDWVLARMLPPNLY